MQFPVLPQAGSGNREVGAFAAVREMGGIQAIPPFVGGRRADESVPGHGGGSDAGDTGPAGMQALGPGAVLEELQTPAGHRQRDPLCHDQLRLRQPQQSAGRKGAAERTHQSGRVEAERMKAALGHRGQASSRLDAKHKGGQHVAAAGMQGRPLREHGRQQTHRRMEHPGHMGIVVVEPMHEDAVDHDRVAHREPRVHAEHDGVAAAAEGAGACQRGAREIEGGGSETDADGIEHQVLGAFAGDGRQVVERGFGHKRGESGGNRLHRLRDWFQDCGHGMPFRL